MLDTRWWKLASLWETGLWVHHCPFHSQTEMVSFFLPLLSNSRCSFSISNQHKWYFYCVSVHQINLEDCGSYYILHFLLSFVTPSHRMCIKSIVDKSTFEAISDDCPHLQNFCTALEHIFTHRLQQCEWSNLWAIGVISVVYVCLPLLTSYCKLAMKVF